MKLTSLMMGLVLTSSVMSAYIERSDSETALITLAPDATSTHTAVAAEVETTVMLNKRINADSLEEKKKKLMEAYKAKFGSNEGEKKDDSPKPWVRTIYTNVKEIVRPTVIQGVTISAKPPKTTNGLEPWISLNKNGAPKTIVPQLKNGHIKKASPTYGTWFATPTTIRYTKEELKAHNMAADEIHEEVEWVPEDQTYHELNPIIRCTPDSYFKKGLSKDTSSAPFCFPFDNQVWYRDKTYFVTWYSHYFEGAEKVRLHLSVIKPSLKDHGLKKRSAIMDKGGKITIPSFFTTDWVDNDDGMLALEVIEEFFPKDAMERKVLLSIQPNTVTDEDFDLLKNSLVLTLNKPGKVYKGHNEDLDYLDEKQRMKNLNVEIDEGLDYEKYFAIMGIPLFVVALAMGMYLFVKVNKVDLSHLKPKKARGTDHNHRRIPFKKKKAYSPLSQNSSDIPLKNMTKND